MADYVIPSIVEQQMDDDSEPEGSLPGSITTDDLAASSLVKGPASKAPPKTADHCRAQWSMTVCGYRVCMLQAAQATQGSSVTSSRTKSFKQYLARLPRP